MQTILKPIQKFFLLLFPFLLYVILVILVDPFNYFSAIPSVIPDEIKNVSSRSSNESLWRMIEYRERKSPNIILGDSRIMRMDVDLIGQYTGKEFYNLGSGGATINDMITTFWHADQLTEIESVYIGLSFDDYNNFDRRDNISPVIQIVENSALYLLNRSVMRSVFFNLRDLILDQTTHYGIPDMSKEDFWSQQLSYARTQRFTRYQYPRDYFEELSKISEYCQKHNIEIYFIILPSHLDIHHIISNANLELEEERFLSDLNRLAPTYNYNQDINWLRDKNNFTDPFHSTEDILIRIVEQTWSNRSKLLE